MKFDVVFSNPPYTKNVDIKILNDIIDCAEEFVIVHPSTPILQYKDKFKPYLNFKKIKGFRSSFSMATRFLILDCLFHAWSLIFKNHTLARFL